MALIAALPIFLLALLAPAQATLNGRCTVGSTPGTCIATADCSSAGGTYASGYCPNDPTDVKCCYKTSCDSGKGSCKWSDTCSGMSIAGYCPGPTNFECCETSTTSGNHPAVAQYADAHWTCATAGCTSTVSAGSAQPSYQCAEFVSRSLAAGGLVPGLSASAAQSSYGSYTYNGVTYDLLWCSSKEGSPRGLEDFLIASGWRSVSITAANVQQASVIFMRSWGHVVVGVGSNLIDAHNNARYHEPLSYYSGEGLLAIYVK